MKKLICDVCNEEIDANAYTDLIYKGSTPDFTSIWKDFLEGSEK